MRDGPWATGLAAVMEAVLTGISGMFVYFLLSVLRLSNLRAFMAAVATMVSVLAWACLGCSLLVFAFRF